MIHLKNPMNMSPPGQACMIQAVTANKISLVRSVGSYFSIAGPVRHGQVRKLGMTTVIYLCRAMHIRIVHRQLEL